MRDKLLIGGAIALAAVLAACGGGGGHAAPALPSQSGAPSSGSRGTAMISIKIPASKKLMNSLKRGVKYVSAATDTMVVIASANGVATSPQTFSLAANSSLCIADVNGDGGRTCSASVIAPIGPNDAFDVTLEQTVNAQGPISPPLPLAHGVLSGQDITEGQANVPTMSLVLGGVVKLAYVSVGPVSGTDFTQTFADENSPPGIPINVHAEDPSYNIIIGDYDTSAVSAQVFLPTPDYGGYVDSTGASANNHVYLSSSEQLYYVPSSATGTYGADANSTGDILVLNTYLTTGSGANQSTSVGTYETYYTPGQIPSSTITTPIATGPFTIGAEDSNAAYVTANGGVATFSGTDATLDPTQQCGSYVDGSNNVVPIVPTSAVNVNNSGGFQGYALAANTVYALGTPNPFASPPANAAAPVCEASALPQSVANLGNLRNLAYNTSMGELVLNSDFAPVVAIQNYTFSPTWLPIGYGTYAHGAAPAASSPDGLLSDPYSSLVYFTDSAGGIVGAADLAQLSIKDEFRQDADSGLAPPYKGLAIDSLGDVGFTANGAVYVFNEGVDPESIYELQHELGRTNGAVIGGAFSDVGSIEGNTFQQYWTIDSTGALMSFGFVQNIYYQDEGFSYGATSTTQIGPATAITSFPNYPLYIATSSGIIQYPNQGIFTQDMTASAHRQPRTHARGSLVRHR